MDTIFKSKLRPGIDKNVQIALEQEWWQHNQEYEAKKQFLAEQKGKISNYRYYKLKKEVDEFGREDWLKVARLVGNYEQTNITR